MTNELEERNRKRKARRTRKRLLSFLAFILLLIYIPALWNWVFSVNYEVGVIKTATLEIKVPLKGVMIRKETVLKSPGNGIIIPSIQYGDRVANGSEVAAYIQSDVREVVDNYRQMEIEILKRVVAEFDNAAGSERALWENAIETQINKLTELSNSNDMSDADSVRNAVDRVLEARARYMLDNGASSSLKNEKSELDRLRNSIEKSVSSIYASASGIVSYHCDGYEGTFTPENRNSISLEQIDQVLETQVTSDKFLTPAEISVAADDSFGKLVLNDEGWITFAIPEKQGKEVAVLYEKAELEGRQIKFDIELEGAIDRFPVILEQVAESSDGLVEITAKMNMLIEQTMDLRGVTGSLIMQSVTGMKVPLRSLFNVNPVDDTADIAIVEMNKAKFLRIQIIGRQDAYAIIENLDPTDTERSVKAFDIYLVNPKNVVEGQVIEK